MIGLSNWYLEGEVIAVLHPKLLDLSNLQFFSDSAFLLQQLFITQNNLKYVVCQKLFTF